MRNATRDGAVGNHFGGLERASLGTNISGVDDTISNNGDPSAVLVFIFGVELAQDLCVVDFFAAVFEGSLVTYDVEDVSALDTLC